MNFEVVEFRKNKDNKDNNMIISRYGVPFFFTVFLFKTEAH